MNFNVNYIVKEEEGIVVCILSECALNAVALTAKYSGVVPNCLCDIPENFFISDEYKGVAKCDPKDTFNVEDGKRLAYRIAYKKYATALEKKVKFIAEDYKKYVAERVAGFEKAVERVNGKGDKAAELLNKVLGELN